MYGTRHGDRQSTGARSKVYAVKASGTFDPDALASGPAFGGILCRGQSDTGHAIEAAFTKRDRPIIPLIPGLPDTARFLAERRVCMNTTASDGIAALLGAAA